MPNVILPLEGAWVKKVEASQTGLVLSGQKPYKVPLSLLRPCEDTEDSHQEKRGPSPDTESARPMMLNFLAYQTENCL